MLRVHVFNDIARRLEPAAIDDTQIQSIELTMVRLYGPEGYATCFKVVLARGLYYYVEARHLAAVQTVLAAR
jgi:hypothetical protein